MDFTFKFGCMWWEYWINLIILYFRDLFEECDCRYWRLSLFDEAITKLEHLKPNVSKYKMNSLQCFTIMVTIATSIRYDECLAIMMTQSPRSLRLVWFHVPNSGRLITLSWPFKILDGINEMDRRLAAIIPKPRLSTMFINAKRHYQVPFNSFLSYFTGTVPVDPFSSSNDISFPFQSAQDISLTGQLNFSNTQIVNCVKHSINSIIIIIVPKIFYILLSAFLGHSTAMAKRFAKLSLLFQNGFHSISLRDIYIKISYLDTFQHFIWMRLGRAGIHLRFPSPNHALSLPFAQ